MRIETDAAIYEDGRVTLKGNPLKTTTDILCPRCHLPRLLHPTDGLGSKKPDPAITYCKKHPFINKAGCDIYGQSWVQPGPGRGKKKKDMEKENPTPEQRPPNVLSFPSATCSKCKRCILVTRLNNHMGSCIGNSGRNASRAAAQKITNGGGSQNDGTPPSSQKATPAPGSRAASPRKRDASEEPEEEPEATPKKKKLKPTTQTPVPPPTAGAATTKKVIIKAGKPTLKKEKVKVASQLSQEQSADYDGPSGAVQVAPKKAAPKISPIKKMKGKPVLSAATIKNGKDVDAESESSGNLSSPPAGN